MSEWRDIPATGGAGGDSQPEVREQLASHLLSSLQMQNLLVLTGLGTSLEAGGPAMHELWEICVGSNPGDSEKAVLKELNYEEGERNIEELLSRCDAQLHASGDSAGIDAFRKACIAKILQRCRAVAGGAEDLRSHREFIRRLARRRVRDPRLRLFTTNYDLCFERAAGALGLTAIDGFSFSNPRRFDPRYFDYDMVRRAAHGGEGPEYVPGVFQYLKIHGSVDWELDARGGVSINNDVAAEAACLIYPTRQKYQFSFQQPHLELMAQFLGSLRQPNTCLLVIGFGFNDLHLTEPIMAAIETNPHLRLVIVSPRCDVHYDGGEGVWQRLRQAFARRDDVGFVKAKFSEFVPLIPDLRALTPGERLERTIRQVAGSAK